MPKKYNPDINLDIVDANKKINNQKGISINIADTNKKVIIQA